MRRAYIGLSTPIGFDYGNPATKAPADMVSSPNPVLDAPFGLLLLFDELVFLTRSLCPENMRNLSYVKFLDESEGLPVLSDVEIAEVVNGADSEHWRDVRSQVEYENSQSFSDIILSAGATWKMGIDNHSHALSIGPIRKQANASEYNLLIDMLICSRIKSSNLELITNSRLQPILDASGARGADAKLAEILVLEGIPNYLTRKGPYHPVIEEVRNNKYIQEFRSWITEEHAAVSSSEAKDIKEAVEAEIKNAQEQLFLKQFEGKDHYFSIGKAMAGDAVGLLCPVAGTAMTIAQQLCKWNSSKNKRWQAFIVDSRRTLRTKSR